MSTVEPRTGNPHEKIWDHHGGYQWTYFTEDVKERISFFLAQRLSGRNLDLGGGWYLSYPNSTVVDLSRVCLDYNPAVQKIHFDLDELSKGRTLPLRDHSFDSATFISAWQYLEHPKAVVAELKRVLTPGAEVYVVNGQGAGLEECTVGSTRSEGIQRFFDNLGLDTLVEHIPTGKSDEFRSVCVAMPEADIFGETISRIKDKTERRQRDAEICDKPSLFVDEYTDWQLYTIARKLARLARFPITRYSQSYLATVEAFSQRYHLLTGRVPLIFSEHTTEPQLLMTTPGSKNFYEMMCTIGADENAKEDRAVLNKLLGEFGLRFSTHGNYFFGITYTNTETATVRELLRYCEKFKLEEADHWRMTAGNRPQLDRLTGFIAAIGLNSFTKKLQQEIEDALAPRVSDLPAIIDKHRALAYYSIVRAYKQRRGIDDLIAIKNAAQSDSIPVIGMGEINLFDIVPKLRQFIR